MRKEFLSKENFTKYYVNNFSTWVFKKSLNIYWCKLRKLKTKKLKDDYLYLFYSNYLQLLENSFIFLLVLFNDNWIWNIFETKNFSKNLKNLLNIKDEKWKILFWFEFDFFIKRMIKDYIWNNEDEYFKYIKEAIKDYFSYKDLLNSYKHWFRLNSNWWWKTYIWDGSKSFLFLECDSSILYYTKKWNIIYENIYYFNFEYIWLKSEFIINLIDNLKLNYLNVWEKIKKETIYIKDNSIKLKNQTSLFKTEIFEIK